MVSKCTWLVCHWRFDRTFFLGEETSVNSIRVILGTFYWRHPMILCLTER